MAKHEILDKSKRHSENTQFRNVEQISARRRKYTFLLRQILTHIRKGKIKKAYNNIISLELQSSLKVQRREPHSCDIEPHENRPFPLGKMPRKCGRKRLENGENDRAMTVEWRRTFERGHSISSFKTTSIIMALDRSRVVGQPGGQGRAEVGGVVDFNFFVLRIHLLICIILIV